MPKSNKYHFKGFGSPNTTPVPDVIFDELLMKLDNCELRVLMYIIRRTFGFKKASDNIAISQMVEGITKRDGTILDRGTGLSRASVKRALRGLLEKNIIIRRRNQADDGGNDVNTYALRFEEARVSSDTPRVSGDPTPLGSSVTLPLVQQRPPQETVGQQTDLSSSNIRRAVLMEDFGKETALPKSLSVEEPVDTPVRPILAAVSTRPTSGGAGTASMEGIGAVLGRLRPASGVSTDDRSAIAVYVQEVARELGDQAPLRSSVTRALNLYKRSGFALQAFISMLYAARSSVKELARERGSGASSKQAKPIRNRMSYFFTVLSDSLGIAAKSTTAGEAQKVLVHES